MTASIRQSARRRFTSVMLAAVSVSLPVMLATGAAGASASLSARVSGGSLNGVSCPAAHQCLAVGTFTAGSRNLTLAERWNGHRWTVLRTPSPPRPGGELNAVSCASSTRCMAVGSAELIRGSRPLAETWDGSAWTVVPTPRVGRTNAELTGVSCTAAGNCMAVGDEGTFKNPVLSTLAERWSGTAWTVVRTPPPPASGGASLAAVSCTGPRACTAAGYYGSTVSGSLTLAERWNGTSWLRQATPTPRSSGSLAGVACAAVRTCLAVGMRAEKGPSLITGTLGEQWNGTRWTVRRTVNPGGANSAMLESVSCTGPSACIATGGGGREENEAGFTLAESWNGASWRLLKSPSPGSFSDELAGVSCTSPAACMAVGDSVGLGNGRTLAEAWNGTTWSVVPTPRP